MSSNGGKSTSGIFTRVVTSPEGAPRPVDTELALDDTRRGAGGGGGGAGDAPGLVEETGAGGGVGAAAGAGLANGFPPKRERPFEDRLAAAAATLPIPEWSLDGTGGLAELSAESCNGFKSAGNKRRGIRKSASS